MKRLMLSVKEEGEMFWRLSFIFDRIFFQKSQPYTHVA